MQPQNFNNCIAILAIVKHQNWLDASPPFIVLRKNHFNISNHYFKKQLMFRISKNNFFKTCF